MTIQQLEQLKEFYINMQHNIFDLLIGILKIKEGENHND